MLPPHVAIVGIAGLVKTGIPGEDNQMSKPKVYVSDAVVEEVGAGDQAAAVERRNVLTGLSTLEIPANARIVARALITKGLVPPKAAYDALHVAVAAVSGMNYLLTWNCKHIANAAIRDDLAAVIRELGYEPPVLCTPEELMGVDDDG